ncbi:SbcC/MukB-like Walker B domain-containing protein [Desulfosporosinus meridiei]|uniref:Nuclease SbcCD subunit C n=1 Tax=Desulfosporosinus meridiei (strain ATCC BAA-275 / DSM 13257 / KCTC 12902 / NCIMB 13706 / S10) TaxID=768704 RepID=J7ISZ5_DESMD|nr:AAA family ATPase [Desulfosporosinus meridiei]AFQ42253.1 ATPase involved in DNA repair [Desulfosporosinus meridiei DSM 13257]
MRPIKLRIAGLNSFREVQEIDFSKLCETGVFGIFGATGSGKSTILDAITLALYGTVERAANNTQGILNHAENLLTVEYSFSLAVGDQRKVYRAERAYKRSGDRTVKASTCRLVEISDEVETVLASKADEMTKMIEGVLGLNVEDFTRAVVLPQGKFAEFLTIKPKDRRSMLERLFSLEAYGRELSARLSEQLESTKYNLNGVEQRQQGLGDASSERVREAEKDLESSESKAKSITEDLRILKQQYDEAKEVWRLQEQLHQLKDTETRLSAEQAIIDNYAERLSLAERAESIRSLLEEILFSEARFQEARGQAEDSATKLKAARLDKEKAESMWLESSQKRQATEPLCLRRLEQLEQAKSLEIDILTRQGRLNQTRLDYSKHERIRKDLEHKIGASNDRKTVLQKQLKDIKDEINRLTVDPQQRRRVNGSAQALESYDIVFKQAKDLQKDLDKNLLEMKERQSELNDSQEEVRAAQKIVEQFKEVLNRLLQAPPIREEILSEQAQRLERDRHRMVNLERSEREEAVELERLQIIREDIRKIEAEVAAKEQEQRQISQALQNAKEYVELRRVEVQTFEQENLASILAKNLVVGEMCPVCGSTHHPQPANELVDERVDKARIALEKASIDLQALEEKSQKWTTELAVTKARLSSNKVVEQNQVKLVAEKQHSLAAYRGELTEADGLKTSQDLKLQLVEQESILASNRQAFSQWKADQEQWGRKLDDAQSQMVEREKKLNSINAQIASLEGVSQDLQNRLIKVSEEQVKRKEILDDLRGEIAISEISRLQNQYLNWDQMLGTLNKTMAGLEEELRKAGEAQEQFDQEKINCELELQNLTTIGIEAARNLAELQKKCDDLTGGKNAADLLDQVKQELSHVTEAEEALRKLSEKAKEIWTQAEQTQAVSLKTLELSREGLKTAQDRLDQGLRTAQFRSLEEAKNALCPDSERQNMEEAITAYRQNVLLNKQKRIDVEELLKERILLPEEWLAWPIRVKALEQAYTEAIERRGANQQRLEKLKVTHEEWMNLEGQRKTLAHRHTLLKNLQGVFKGNAFVEFIAQEQLTNVSIDASERLRQLTNQRYALEVDSEGGFVMRDDANGGVRRPVSSLSGGETFLTALALALALSTQIQLRGESPLEFFFLDEGFGTLDADLLETVMNILEKLHLQSLTIGIISHVPELKNRLSRRLVLTPAEAGGVGSKVKLEMA